MPRPCKRRCIAGTPKCRSFVPKGLESNNSSVKLSVEEYEVIRLIDYEDMTQMECAREIGVGRTTVQRIYSSARKKIASTIVDVRCLEIEGSHYTLTTKLEYDGRNYSKISRGGNIMTRVAVTYENGNIFQHFGHTENFKIYDIENNEIKESIVVSTNGQGHGALGNFLVENNIDAIICGGIGGGAQQVLSAAGIKIHAGVIGSADEAVAQLIAGSLVYQKEANCSHHDHKDGEEHSCGHHHGEGGSSCHGGGCHGNGNGHC